MTPISVLSDHYEPVFNFANDTRREIRWSVVDETTAKRPNRKTPTASKHFGVQYSSLAEMLVAELAGDEL